MEYAFTSIFNNPDSDWTIDERSPWYINLPEKWEEYKRRS